MGMFSSCCCTTPECRHISVIALARQCGIAKYQDDDIGTWSTPTYTNAYLTGKAVKARLGETSSFIGAIYNSPYAVNTEAFATRRFLTQTYRREGFNFWFNGTDNSWEEIWMQTVATIDAETNMFTEMIVTASAMNHDSGTYPGGTVYHVRLNESVSGGIETVVADDGSNDRYDYSARFETLGTTNRTLVITATEGNDFSEETTAREPNGDGNFVTVSERFITTLTDETSPADAIAAATAMLDTFDLTTDPPTWTPPVGSPVNLGWTGDSMTNKVYFYMISHVYDSADSKYKKVYTLAERTASLFNAAAPSSSQLLQLVEPAARKWIYQLDWLATFNPDIYTEQFDPYAGTYNSVNSFDANDYQKTAVCGLCKMQSTTGIICQTDFEATQWAATDPFVDTSMNTTATYCHKHLAVSSITVGPDDIVDQGRINLFNYCYPGGSSYRPSCCSA